MTDIEYLKEIKDLLRDTADKCWGCNFFDIEEEECKLDKCPLYDSLDKAISALEENQTNTSELPHKYNKDDLIHRETARRIIDSPRSKEQMLMMLASIPKVDNMAEWITFPFQEVRCSKCDYIVWGTEFNTYLEWKYCPNCGSRMKGENQ